MKEKISNFMQVASLRRYELTEGEECGLRVLDCDNGKLRFLLNESKALDVMQLYHEGQNVSFLSKNAFTARELPFENRFEGGMLYTCGLDAVGNRAGLPLHGTLHNTAARVVKATCNEEGICVEAEIRSTALFGKNLLLRRRVFSAIGSETLEIDDTLENCGYMEENYCLLYHVNVGYPMLDEQSEITGDIAGVSPYTAWARERMAEVYQITPPVAGETETVYALRFNKPEVSLCNRTLHKKFTLVWSQESLPCFVEWKSMASGDYALGFEPSTTGLNEAFSYRSIKAGEKISFSLRLIVNKTEN